MHPELKGLLKIYDYKQDGLTLETFLNKNKGWSHTILLIKSNHNKIFGGYIPKQWENFNGHVEIPNGKMFIFFYED